MSAVVVETGVKGWSGAVRSGVMDFFVVSACGATYLVAARSTREAVEVLAESAGLGTDAGDWTRLDDGMFREIRIPGQHSGWNPISRGDLLKQSGGEACLIGVVDIVEPRPEGFLRSFLKAASWTI